MAALAITVLLAPTAAASIIVLPYHYEFGHCMAVDLSGNLYLTGIPNTDPNLPGGDLLVKYDKQGKKVWTRSYHGPVDDWALCTALTADHAGNVYVTGNTTLPTMTRASDDTITACMTLKYDPNGKRLWKAIYCHPRRNVTGALAIAVDHKRNVYVLGDTEPNFASSGTWPTCKIVTIKYDPKGAQLWAVTFGGEKGHQYSPSNIAVDEHGNVYVTTEITTLDDIDSQIVTIKYDTDGKQLWKAAYIEDPNDCYIPGPITSDDAGNVYVAGSLRHSAFVDDHVRSRHSDCVVVRYDPRGKQQYVARCRMKGDGLIFPTAIALDHGGHICLTADLNPSSSGTTSSRINDIVNFIKKSRILTVKFDPKGRELWHATYKGPKGSIVSSRHLMTDSTGNTYHIATVEYDRTDPTDTPVGYLKGLLKDDWFDSGAIVIKYDPNGKQEWVKRYKTASELAKFVAGLAKK
jgi:hypothetical protein